MTTKDKPLVRLPAASVPWQTCRTVFALMLREMGTTYGRSPGGYAWAILEPIGMITVLSLGFSIIVRSPPLGQSFILFFATGYLPFQLFSDSSRKVAGALKFSRALLAYPSVTWLDAIIGRFILVLLTSLTVFCILMTGILLIVSNHVILNFGPIILGMFFAGLIGLSVGILNCLLVGLFPVWKNIWSIISRPLFIASGILFIYDDMPPLAQDILWWNPLIHVSGLVRTGFYPTYHGSYISVTYLVAFILLTLAAGLLFLSANYKKVLEK